MQNSNYNKKSKSGQPVFGRQKRGFTIVIMALIVVIALFASYGIMQLTESSAHSSAEKLVSQVVSHIDEKMNAVTEVTRESAKTAKAELDNPDALEKLVHDFVAENDFIYGSTVAFEPNAFPGKGRSFAPYSWITSDGKIHDRQLGTETDYYKEEWYAETKSSGKEYWCEPYFDEGGAKIMMCTFSIPLKDENGRLAAVMTADVGLEDLENYTSSINPTPESSIVLRSKKGSTLTNSKMESTVGNNTVIIKGMTEIGWSVELIIPFSYLMRGDTGIYILIGLIFLITILLVYGINRLMNRMQQRSSAEYMNVIDAISSSFTSIYMVNLITNETFVFRDPEYIEDIIGKKEDDYKDFTAKLTRFIKHDCCEQDRDRMLWEVTTEAVRSNLSVQDRYEVRFRKEAEGELRWFEMHVFVLEKDKNGVPVRAVVAFTDVNESVLKEKETQDTLEQALTTAQSASKAKTDFLFNMSHDIRTPMNAIIGFTNMAKKHVDDREKLLECLDKTQQSGNLLLTLINSVLDVSRIESGHAKLEESTADVNHSFTAIQDTMIELAAARDISISFEIGQIKDRYVYCDLVRCNRIFVNIISNAIKYTNEGGTVKVRCEQVENTREGYGNYKYTFEDNGIGMSEEFQKTVFDQFTREKSSTVSGIEGSGLGLAVCKSFVDLMKGTIECDSKLGEGTTFTVTLPFRLQHGKLFTDPYTREEVNASEITEHLNAPVVFKGRRALVVEDNELNREIVAEILEDEGLKIDLAEDGSIAVNILREKGPDFYDFILMDIQMPVMNGYEATKAIRKMYPDVKIPIIAVSANAFAEDRSASIEAGMDDHVAKPINVTELFGVLAKYM